MCIRDRCGAEKDGKVSSQINSECIPILESIGSKARTIEEACRCPMVQSYMDKCIAKLNKRSISRAQQIKKYTLLKQDFSINTGEMTPTMKLKRKIIAQKYAKEIEAMYSFTKLQSCLLYTSPSPRDLSTSRMPSSA
eukprot:TRINITY_DN11959_c0_g1_i1.p2 TRINITY_DN11959_c0_g1~~TRINITY_DN11959_c0_g1_i1.p2  ORF type:complete len:137 (-),score=26.81 TRINITY_DN11959_c0_g1_i1:150-560(-)